MQRDYILRLIEQLGQVLTVILGLKQAGKREEAEAVVDQSLRRLAGLSLPEVDALPAEGLVHLIRLTRSGHPSDNSVAEQLTILAVLLREAADLGDDEGDPERVDQRRLKSLQLFLTVLMEEDPDSSHATAAIEPLLGQLSAYDLPAGVKDRLWQYYERTGQFARAEDWLFELLEDEQAGSDVVDRGVMFYRRLAEMSDDELLQGNLPRPEVLAGLAELEAMRGG